MAVTSRSDVEDAPWSLERKEACAAKLAQLLKKRVAGKKRSLVGALVGAHQTQLSFIMLSPFSLGLPHGTDREWAGKSKKLAIRCLSAAFLFRDVHSARWSRPLAIPHTTKPQLSFHRPFISLRCFLEGPFLLQYLAPNSYTRMK